MSLTNNDILIREIRRKNMRWIEPDVVLGKADM